MRVFYLLLVFLGQCDNKSQSLTAIHKTSSGKLDMSQLKPAEQMKLYRSFFRYQKELKSISERYLVEEYIDAEVKKSGDSKLVVQSRIQKVEELTDADVKAYYDANKDRLPYEYEKIKEELKKHMQVDRKLRAQGQSIDKARNSLSYKPLYLDLPAPKFKMDVSKYATKGDGSDHIIEFADFLCPHCRRAHVKVKELAKSSKVTYIHMVPTTRAASVAAAIASECARDQGKFWEFHDLLFSEQPRSKEDIDKISVTLQLDLEKMSTCQSSPEKRNFVDDAIDFATEHGVISTPTFFKNGRFVPGGISELTD